jgi:hypothetical protein
MSTRIKRWIRIVAVVVLLSMIAIGVPAIRWHILRSAGWALVLRQPPAKSADVIVVAVDADGAGALEAADLVRSGVSPRVAVFTDPPDPIVDAEFLRRGIPYEDAAAVSIRQLRALGVDNMEQIARTVAGSEEEGDVLPAWCDQRQYRSVVVVTTSDHSRRLGRVLRRSMKGHQASVTVQAARHSKFDPDRWWLTRGGTRTEIFELEKLLLDLVRHPFS